MEGAPAAAALHNAIAALADADAVRRVSLPPLVDDAQFAGRALAADIDARDARTTSSGCAPTGGSCDWRTPGAGPRHPSRRRHTGERTTTTRAAVAVTGRGGSHTSARPAHWRSTRRALCVCLHPSGGTASGSAWDAKRSDARPAARALSQRQTASSAGTIRRVEEADATRPTTYAALALPRPHCQRGTGYVTAVRGMGDRDRGSPPDDPGATTRRLRAQPSTQRQP